MSPDDPRHGTYAGYVAHNNGTRACEPCREAARRYQAGRLWDKHKGIPRTLDATGTRRRLQALTTLGWDYKTLADMLGVRPQVVHRWTSTATVYRHNAQRVAALYEQLSMRFPPTDTESQRNVIGRTKALARRRGFAPPLAWDNIDNDPTPAGTRDRKPLSTLAEYRHLTEGGITPDRAMQRLGVKRSAIEAAIRRERKAA